MSETDRQKRKLRSFNRGIGMFYGGLLGLFVSGLVVMLFGDVGIPVGLLVIAGGIAVGLAIGYAFPCVTEAACWVLSIFG